MIQIVNDIKNLKYNKLVIYASQRCDTFTFTIPDYYKEPDSLSRSLEYQKYVERISYRLEMFKPYILKKYIDKEFCGSVANYYAETYILSLNEYSIGSIMATKGLYSWQAPDMPEDLCFYKLGKCWLQSIAHESKCWIYTNDTIELDTLKKVIGLRFVTLNDIDPPCLII